MINPLNIIRGFDPDLFTYFESELEHQRLSLSFVPDENSQSPLCSSILGSILINSTDYPTQVQAIGLEQLTANRLCNLFKADHANVRAVTIEAASRVVFQSITTRGDVVMSLNLRKKEHCNTEALAFRFVNFGMDAKTGIIDYDNFEKQAKECNPKLIILSPVNYPLEIDYERISKVAKECGAYLWCDISQIAGLIAGGAMKTPIPYADVVTFTSHGPMQGPQAAVILCKKELASAIDRTAVSSNHLGLQTSQLAALAARIHEMEHTRYRSYTHAVVDNARTLAETFKKSGLHVICDTSESHLVIVDSKNLAISARGAQELLNDVGISVRICQVATNDPNIKYDAIRFSSLPCTTRGIADSDLQKIGESIAKFLLKPNEDNTKELRELISVTTVGLPTFFEGWLCTKVKENLTQIGYMKKDSIQMCDSIHESRIALFRRYMTKSRK